MHAFNTVSEKDHYQLLKGEEKWIREMSEDHGTYAITILLKPQLGNPSDQRLNQDLRHLYNILARAVASHPSPAHSPALFLWPDLPSPQTKEVYSHAVLERNLDAAIPHRDKLDYYGIHFHGFLFVPKSHLTRFKKSLLDVHGNEPAVAHDAVIATKLRAKIPLIERVHIRPVESAAEWHAYARKAIPRSELRDKERRIFKMIEHLPSQRRRRRQSQIRSNRRRQSLTRITRCK